MKTLVVSLVLAAAVGLPAQAQTPLAAQPIDSGALVRIRTLSGSAVRGRLFNRLEPSSSHLQLCIYPGRSCTQPSDERVRTFATADISRIDIAAGSRWRTGALIGALLGAASGSLGHAFAEDSDAHSGPVAPEAQFLIIGALGGALWGAIFGAGFDAWRLAP